MNSCLNKVKRVKVERKKVKTTSVSDRNVEKSSELSRGSHHAGQEPGAEGAKPDGPAAELAVKLSKPFSNASLHGRSPVDEATRRS